MAGLGFIVLKVSIMIWAKVIVIARANMASVQIMSTEFTMNVTDSVNVFAGVFRAGFPRNRTSV